LGIGAPVTGIPGIPGPAGISVAAEPLDADKILANLRGDVKTKREHLSNVRLEKRLRPAFLGLLERVAHADPRACGQWTS
jgi:hypothetical protein